ncbi:MAG: tyrosine-protein phosphatase [Candidatus Spyradocola sp.]|nr:tyrosine-protein phosphatase [Candidatus Spyradocola sp.]
MSPLKGTEREFALDGVKNARDLGGIPLPGGGTTAFGRFLRTDAPFMLRECGRAKLLKAGFDRVLDLRSDGEAGSRPTCLSADGRFAVCRSPLAGNGRIPATRDEVPETYLEMVRGQAQMRRALAFLADAPRGAVIHCTAGKDRTGVVCALLLANAGVGVEEIAADYARTQQRMGGVLERICRENPALRYDALVAREENILRFWEMFLGEYGDAERYLRRIGLEEARIQGLREKLRK